MEMSFRDQLKAGLLSVTTKIDIKNKIHKFKGNYTITSDGFCEYEVPEGNYFLLKESRHRRIK